MAVAIGMHAMNMALARFGLALQGGQYGEV